MKQEKQTENTEKTLRFSKRLVLICAVSLVLCLAVGITVAYLISSTDEVKNSFTPAEVTCEVEEDVKDGKKSSVQIENTGNTDAYIRVAVIANSVNEKGEILGAADVSNALAGAGWILHEGYYYWNAAVEPGKSTGELLTEACVNAGGIDLAGMQVTILAEAIQSEGTNSEGVKPVVLAWGFDPTAPASN